MGLIMLGAGNEETFDEMLQYIHKTQNEKIIRRLAISIPFIICTAKKSKLTSGSKSYCKTKILYLVMVVFIPLLWLITLLVTTKLSAAYFILLLVM